MADQLPARVLAERHELLAGLYRHFADQAEPVDPPTVAIDLAAVAGQVPTVPPPPPDTPLPAQRGAHRPRPGAMTPDGERSGAVVR